MGLQLSRTIVLADVPLDWATFEFGGTDRIDITATGNDINVELRPPGRGYQPGDAMTVSADTFESFSGLAISYPPTGVWGFRVYNAVAGKQATAKIRAYGVRQQ